MLVAIPATNGEVSPHFGHCAEFLLYEVEDGQVANKSAVENPGHQPGVLPRFLADLGVKCVIASGMGSRAQTLFEQSGISTVCGAMGPADEVISEFARGALATSDNACDHLEHPEDNGCSG